MQFGQVREAVLAKWLKETKRERVDGDDIISSSYECDWQRCFKTDGSQDKYHYSIFCSMGEWNTMITDFLEDARFDNLDFGDEKVHRVLYRHFGRLFLAVSEAMTDFQDMLTILRTGTLEADSDENNLSRELLSRYAGRATFVNEFFNFTNKIMKHKARNIHLCNHHMKFHFEDSGNPYAGTDAIEVSNVGQFISRKPTIPPQRKGKAIVIPSLDDIVTAVLNGYKVVDEEFRADLVSFEHFIKEFQMEIEAPDISETGATGTMPSPVAV